MTTRRAFGIKATLSDEAKVMMNSLSIGRLAWLMNTFTRNNTYPNAVPIEAAALVLLEPYRGYMGLLLARYNSLSARASAMLTPFSVVEAMETCNLDVRMRRITSDPFNFGIPESDEEKAIEEERMQATGSVTVRDCALGTTFPLQSNFEFVNYAGWESEGIVKSSYIQQCAHATFYAAMFTKLDKGKVVANYTANAAKKVNMKLSPSISAELCEVLETLKNNHPRDFDGVTSVAGVNWAKIVYKMINDDDAITRTDLVCTILVSALSDYPDMLMPLTGPMKSKLLGEFPEYPATGMRIFCKPQMVRMIKWSGLDSEKALKFLQDSRNFRGKDEDGMSALSFPFYSRVFVSKATGRRMQSAAQITNLARSDLVICGVDIVVANSLLETLRVMGHSFAFSGLSAGVLGDTVVTRSTIANLEGRTVFDFSTRTYPEKQAKVSFQEYAEARFQHAADHAGVALRCGAQTVIVFVMALTMPKKCTIDGKTVHVHYGLSTSPHSMVVPVAFCTKNESPFLRTYSSLLQWNEAVTHANYLRNTYFRHRSYVGAAFKTLNIPCLAWKHVPPNVATKEMKLSTEEMDLFAGCEEGASILDMDMGIDDTEAERSVKVKRLAAKKKKQVKEPEYTDPEKDAEEEEWDMSKFGVSDGEDEEMGEKEEDDNFT